MSQVQLSLCQKFFRWLPLRRRMLINRRPQLHLMGFVGGYAVLVHFVSIITFEALRFSRSYILSSILVLGTILLIAFGMYIFLVVSNRVFGPIYRLHQTLRQVLQDGHIRKIHFRKDDYFHDLASDFNRVMDQLERSEIKSEKKDSL